MTKPTETPITDCLFETASMLGMDTAGNDGGMSIGSGFLLQAEIMREIARRLLALEQSKA